MRSDWNSCLRLMDKDFSIKSFSNRLLASTTSYVFMSMQFLPEIERWFIWFCAFLVNRPIN
jgi:hypothetical protein